MSRDAVLYIHGKGGRPDEAEHYRALFPAHEVLGLDYRGAAPQTAGPEIRAAVGALAAEGKAVTLVANSVGAYFAMAAGVDDLVKKAYFISPIVDMETLISDMMGLSGVTEDELREKGVIPTAFGEDLSWEYLAYVRAHPVQWTVPTAVLYGSRDDVTAYETVAAFSEKHGAALTVMDGGEHWFHTPEQMAFLDDWIQKGEASG